METYDSPAQPSPGTKLLKLQDVSRNTNKIYEKIEIADCVQKQIEITLTGLEYNSNESGTAPMYDKAIYNSVERTYKPLSEVMNQTKCFEANVLWNEITSVVAPALIRSTKPVSVDASLAQKINITATFSNANVLLPLKVVQPGFMSINIDLEINARYLTPYLEPIKIPDILFLEGYTSGEFTSSTPIFEMLKKWNEKLKKSEMREKKERYYIIHIKMGEELWKEAQPTFEIIQNSKAFDHKKHPRYYPHKLYLSKSGFNYLMDKTNMATKRGKATPGDRVELTIGSHLASIHALANLTLDNSDVVVGAFPGTSNKDICMFLTGFSNANVIIPIGLRHVNEIVKNNNGLNSKALYPIRSDFVSSKIRESLKKNYAVFDTSNGMFVQGYNNALGLIQIIETEMGSTSNSDFLFDHIIPEYLEYMKINTAATDQSHKIVLPNPVPVFVPQAVNSRPGYSMQN